MKAPVGLLSDRTVLRSKMEGLCPDKFQFVRISGYLWQNCEPGMPGPYRVTMRKPDMALKLAGRLYAAPTNRRKVYDKERVEGGVLGAPRRGQDFSLRMNRKRDAPVSRGSRFSRA